MHEPISELRRSAYYQQLGQEMCAAFVAQQQGNALDTALKKVPDAIDDLRLIVAEVARETCMISNWNSTAGHATLAR